MINGDLNQAEFAAGSTEIICMCMETALTTFELRNVSPPSSVVKVDRMSPHIGSMLGGATVRDPA